MSARGLAIAIGKLRARLLYLVSADFTYAPNERFAKHLYRHRYDIFTYLQIPGVEATNCLAEQAIRPAVVNRKVWGGSRTEKGALAQAILTTTFRNWELKGNDMMRQLAKTLQNYRSAVG